MCIRDRLNTSAVNFLILPEQQTTFVEEEAKIQIILESNETVYGYDIILNSSAEYQSHLFYLNNLNNTLNALTADTELVRTAMITEQGITGNKTIIEIRYAAKILGEHEIKGTAKAYDKNGNELQTSTTTAKITAKGNEIKLEDKITTNKTTTMNVCIQNAQKIERADFELEFDQAKTELLNLTKNISITNKTSSIECETVLTLTFNIKTLGEEIPVKIQITNSTPALDFLSLIHI